MLILIRIIQAKIFATLSKLGFENLDNYLSVEEQIRFKKVGLISIYRHSQSFIRLFADFRFKNISTLKLAKYGKKLRTSWNMKGSGQLRPMKNACVHPGR